jgi:murein DD-endopeptidase / murein LD-carboxypeptidase
VFILRIRTILSQRFKVIHKLRAVMLRKSLGGVFMLLMVAFTLAAQKPASKKKQPVKKQTSKLTEGLPEMQAATLEKDVRTNRFDSIILKAQAAINNPAQGSDGSFDLRKTLGVALESFMPFQFKYAILLNESVEKLTNVVLYKTIDDWYGTRYRFGGTTPRGIDCSAFMQVLGNYAFGWMLPRTARAQYYAMEHISKDDLKEGDFVFFNTRGGISHVGMYLQNNKFVHSSSSDGVSIGDLNSKYWSARFVGARRAPKEPPSTGDFRVNID